MSAIVERLDNHRVALDVEVPREKVEAALDRAYRKLVRRVNIPGFRKGKAPRAIFERFVGRAALWDEALDGLVTEAYYDAVQETGVEPIEQPEIELKPLDESESVRFRAEVMVKPEVRLGDYRALRLPLEVEEVTDADVDRVLEELRQSRAELVPVEEPRELARGDFAVIDFDGRLEDGAAIPNGSARDYMVEVGAGQVLPEFEEGLVGMRPDETRNIPVTFPEDYGAAELAGKAATFSVTLKEIKERHLPPLDDAFARENGDYSSLEELRGEVRNRLAEAARARARRRLEEQAVERVVAEASVDLPGALIGRRQAQILEDMEKRLAAGGRSIDEQLQAEGRSRESFDAEVRERAARDVKTELVLDAVAKAEGIEVAGDELRAEVERIAQSFGRENAAQVRRLILNDPDQLADVRASLRTRLTVERLGRIAAGEPDPAGSDTQATSNADGEAGR